MSLFDKLFRKKSELLEPVPAKEIPFKAADISTDWQELPGYVPVDPAAETLVSLVATAIAAGDQPDSQFRVKRVLKRNPEIELVAVIASSLAAEAMPESQFRITKIAKKIEGAN